MYKFVKLPPGQIVAFYGPTSRYAAIRVRPIMLPRITANLPAFRLRLLHLLKYRAALRYEYARGSKWAFLEAWWRPDQRRHFAEVGRRIDRLNELCRRLEKESHE